MGDRRSNVDREDVIGGCACRRSTGGLSGGTESPFSDDAGDGELRPGVEGEGTCGGGSRCRVCSSALTRARARSLPRGISTGLNW